MSGAHRHLRLVPDRVATGGGVCRRFGCPADAVRLSLCDPCLAGYRAQLARDERALLTVFGALALLPLALADSLLVLGLLLLVAGAPFTAQWAARSLALDALAPPDSAAEAYNWLSTGNATGIALGGLLAGAAIELSGTSAAFLATAAVVALAAAVIIALQRKLSPTPTPQA